jgi:cell division protein FtsA
MGIPYEMAEQVKVKYADLTPRADGKAKVEPAVVGMENGHEILVQDLNDIVRARIDELMRMVAMELPREELATLAPAGLVLTGGTANLPGIEAIAEDVFRIPVRVGAPQDVYGLADILYDPAYATAVGLLKWGAKRTGTDPVPATPLEAMGRTLRHYLFRAQRTIVRARQERR